MASIQLTHDGIERRTNASTAINHRISYKSDNFLVKDVDAWHELASSLQLESQSLTSCYFDVSTSNSSVVGWPARDLSDISRAAPTHVTGDVTGDVT
jgi:hypothetical protein